MFSFLASDFSTFRVVFSVRKQKCHSARGALAEPVTEIENADENLLCEVELQKFTLFILLPEFERTERLR